MRCSWTYTLEAYRPQGLHGALQVEPLFHIGVQARMLLHCGRRGACESVSKGSKARRLLRPPSVYQESRNQEESRTQASQDRRKHLKTDASILDRRGAWDWDVSSHQERQYLPEKDEEFVGEHLLDRQARGRWSVQNLYLHPHIH